MSDGMNRKSVSKASYREFFHKHFFAITEAELRMPFGV